MPLAKDIAVELRKLADSMDAHPELELDKPYITFYFWRKDQKQRFLNTAKIMLRPFSKEHPKQDDGDLKLIYSSEFMHISNR